MNDQADAEYREHVVRTVEYNTGGKNLLETIDAAYIRIHVCANAGYQPEAINQAIADILKAGELREGGYVVAE